MLTETFGKMYVQEPLGEFYASLLLAGPLCSPASETGFSGLFSSLPCDFDAVLASLPHTISGQLPNLEEIWQNGKFECWKAWSGLMGLP